MVKCFFPLALLLAFSLAVADEGDRPKPTLKDFMRVKLTHSQKVLEGLTTNDFDLISKSAAELKLLSQSSAWEVMTTEDYIAQSSEFRRATEALSKAAEKKNLDAAALAYMDVTMKCVNCHKYVRGVRTAGPDLRGAPNPKR